MQTKLVLKQQSALKLRFAAGATGPSGTTTVNPTTITGAPGTDASVANTGTPTAAVLQFTIPRGNTGAAATVAAGTTTTGSPGTSASVTNGGTSSAAVFNFTIPRGDVGTAATIAVGTVTTGAAGSSATITNAGTSAAAVFNFSIPRGFDGVSDGDKGDVTVSSTGTVWTVDANAIADTKLRQSTALTVIGRASNSTGNVADIAAGTDGHVLRRSGTTLGFGTTATDGIADDAITNAKLANMAAGLIKGRATASTGDPEDLTAAQVRAVIGATTVGAAVLMATDAAAGRTAIAAGPQPQTGAGVGQFFKAPGADATPFTMPAGGTWLWYYYGIGVATGAVNFAQTSGISAGGTTVASGSAGTGWFGWSLRIT